MANLWIFVRRTEKYGYRVYLRIIRSTYVRYDIMLDYEAALQLAIIKLSQHFSIIIKLYFIHHFLLMLPSTEILQISSAQIQQVYQLIWQELITFHISSACMIEPTPASF